MNICVMEDDNDHLALIVYAIKKAFGANVKISAFARLMEGFAHAGKDNPDIMLVDLTLKDSARNETIEYLRNAQSEIPILVLSSTQELEVSQELVSQGIQDFFPKASITSEAIYRAINHSIERQKLFNKLGRLNKNHRFFSRVLAHDLLSNFSSVYQLLEILPHEISNGTTKKNNITDLINNARTMVKDAINMIKSLHQYVRTEDPSHNYTVADLKEFIEHTTSTQTLASNTEVDLIIEGNSIQVDINRTFLQMALDNLISNAIKYCKNKPVIKISWQEVGSDVEITISDNGIGIPEEKKHLIFKPFERFHENEDYSGTGLGLSIVERSIDYHRGAVTFSGNLQGGTDVMIRLPLKQNSTADDSNTI